MECKKTKQEVEPIEVQPGVLRCPACGELFDEETLNVWRCDNCGRTADEVDVNPNGVSGLCRECDPNGASYPHATESA